MPSRSLQPCSSIGCPQLVKSGKCERCRGMKRLTAADAGYGSKWKKTRTEFLDVFTQCVLCGRVANVADHYPVSRKNLVRQGAADPDAWDHLRPLCRKCHSKETAKHQPSGWNDR